MGFFDPKQIGGFLDDEESASGFILKRCARELAKWHRLTVVPALKEKGFATGQNEGQEKLEEGFLKFMREGALLVEQEENLVFNFYMLSPLTGKHQKMAITIKLVE